VRPPIGAPPRTGSAAPTGADEAFDVSDDDFDDHDLDHDLDALSLDGDECEGSGGRRGADDLDGDFDEPSPEKAPSAPKSPVFTAGKGFTAPKSPGWKAPTAASLLSDDDGSDSDDGEERLLGKGTAKLLSGLLDSRAAAKPTYGGAVPFGAPFKPSSLGALGGRPPLGGALGGPALKPLGAALGGAGSSLAPLGAGRWK